MAKALGVSAHPLGNVCRGKGRPSLYLLLAIAAHFKTSLLCFFKGTVEEVDEPPSKPEQISPLRTPRAASLDAEVAALEAAFDEGAGSWEPWVAIARRWDVTTDRIRRGYPELYARTLAAQERVRAQKRESAREEFSTAFRSVLTDGSRAGNLPSAQAAVVHAWERMGSPEGSSPWTLRKKHKEMIEQMYRTCSNDSSSK